MISDSDDSASTSTVDLQPLRELFQQCDLNLSQQKVESIIEKFVTLGIENIDDLKLLTESDLLPILPLIKCRKLLNYVNKAVESAVQDASISATLTPIPNTVNDSTSHDGSTKVTMPWQRFSKSLKDCLEKNEIPTPAQRREIVRILGDELLEKCRSPNRTDVRRLAKLVVQSYPKAFEDKSLGGTKIQDGSASLTIQLENRLYNLKRDSTETIEVANNEAEDSEAVPRKRKQRISQYGCVQLSLKDVTSDMELESCKRKLQEMFENQETDSTAIQEMYQNCFTNICNIIHSQKHSITTLKGDWPILFTFAGLKIHYQLLTDRNLDNFSQSICQSRGNVLQCMQLFQHGNKALQVVLKRVYQAKELTGSNQCEIIGILHLLCAYFKEDIAFLYQINEDANSDIPTTPCIIGNGDSEFFTRHYEIFVDGTKVLQINQAEHAIASLFACYYIFNIEYPKEVNHTLDFLQRAYAEIEGKGKKGKKPSSKAYTLLRKIKEVVSEE